MKAAGIATVLMLALVGSTYAQSPSQKWAIYGAGDDGRFDAYDINSVRVIGDHRRVWTISLDANADSEVPGFSLTNWELDCVDETLQIRSITEYEADGSSPEMVEVSHTTVPIVLGSNSWNLMQSVCAGAEVGPTFERTPQDAAAVLRELLAGWVARP